MRSVVVVLPASMWAIMPILRVRSNGYALGIGYLLVSIVSLKLFVGSVLKFEMRKCFIGFRHLVHVFFFLDRVAFVICSSHKFCRKLQRHRFIFAFRGISDQPANRQR